MIDNILLRTRKAISIGVFAFLACYAVIYIHDSAPSLPNASRVIVSRPSSRTASRSQEQLIQSTTSTSLAAKALQKGQHYAQSFVPDDYTLRGRQGKPPFWWCTQEPYDKSCKNETHQLCNPKGLLFVKTPKTGSTTVSRIVKRIVHNVAQRNHVDVCQHREDHVTGAGEWYGSRVRSKSFLMASLRDPAERAISRYFWSYVTRHSNQTTEVQPDDAFILNYINTTTSVASGCTSKGQGGYQLNYVALQSIQEWSAWDPQRPTKMIHEEQTEHYVAQVMQDYDFIVLNERMEESLVILQLLLGLETGDIVSLSYNVGGSYRYQNGKCAKLIKSHISPGMEKYFQAEEWYAKNYGDYLLHAAVNRSIDLSIDALGRDRVEDATQEFRRLEAKVNKICNERVPFPCSEDGTVLFHTTQPVPLDKINQCIDDVVQQDKQQENNPQSWIRL
jgi:hypothetical protein